MDRSLFPEGVEVHQDDLKRTESSRSFHILKRHLDTSTLGVVSDFDITLNIGDNTLIDAAAGTGYAPDGEFIDFTTSQIGLSLSDYTLNTINLVVAIYTETSGELENHETNGNSFATSADRSVRLRIFTQAEFDALPATDTNLNNDAQDRSLVLAQITAQGVGVLLVASNIVNATTFQNAISAENTTDNITGISISSIDKTTSDGLGTLVFTFSSTELKWKPPGEVVFGSPIILTSSGLATVTSAAGKTLSMLVVFGSLPISDQTDTISITNIYSQTVSSFSAEDAHHRSQIGTGIPSATNPHGLSIVDLGASDATITHQDLFHSNGILKTSAATVLLSVVNTSTTPDEIAITLPVSGDSLYLNGIEHSLLSSSILIFSDVGVNQQSLWDIYIVEGVAGIVTSEKRERIHYDDIAPPLLAGVVQLKDLSTSIPAGASKIFYDDVNKTLEFFISTDTNFATPSTGTGTAVSVPNGNEATVVVPNEDGLHGITLFVDDLANWGGLSGGGNLTEDLTVLARPTTNELEARLRISTTMFSGNTTGFLGNGFGASNSPNTLTDQRLFGITGVDDLRDDVTNFIDSQIDLKTNEVTVGTGAFPSTGEFNASDFTSASLAIQAAMDALAAAFPGGGGVVNIKPGIYIFDVSNGEGIAFDTQHTGITIIGSGAGTEFRVTSGTSLTTSIIKVQDAVENWNIEKIKFNVIEDVSTVAGGHIIEISGSNGFVNKCIFEGITFAQTNIVNFIKTTFDATNIKNIVVENCIFERIIRHVYESFGTAADGLTTKQNQIMRNCVLNGGWDTSVEPIDGMGIVRFLGGSYNRFENNFIDMVGLGDFADVLALSGGVGGTVTKYNKVLNNTFTGTRIRRAVFCDEAEFSTIMGNTFIDVNEPVRLGALHQGDIVGLNTYVNTIDIPVFVGTTGTGDNAPSAIVTNNIIAIEEATVTGTMAIAIDFAGDFGSINNNVINMDGVGQSIVIRDSYVSCSSNVINRPNSASGAIEVLDNSNMIVNNAISASIGAGSMINVGSSNVNVVVVGNVLETIASTVDAIVSTNPIRHVYANNVLSSASSGNGVRIIRTISDIEFNTVIAGNAITNSSQTSTTGIIFEANESSTTNLWECITIGNVISGPDIGIDTRAGTNTAPPDQHLFMGNIVNNCNDGIINDQSDDGVSISIGNIVSVDEQAIRNIGMVTSNMCTTNVLGGGTVIIVQGSFIALGNLVKDTAPATAANVTAMNGNYDVAIGNVVSSIGTAQTGGISTGISLNQARSVIIGNKVDNIGSASTATTIAFTNSGTAKNALVGNVVNNALEATAPISFNITGSTGNNLNVYALNITNAIVENVANDVSFPHNGNTASYDWGGPLAVAIDTANQNV